jgi:hypothetical protein
MPKRNGTIEYAWHGFITLICINYLKNKLSIMSLNLSETIQKNLGFPALHKADPNGEQVKDSSRLPGINSLSQAAIPAVLTGLYRYVQTDEGAADFLRGDNSTSWAERIFGWDKNKAVHKIASYADQPASVVESTINNIANEAVKVVKGNIPATAGINAIKLFFTDQRNVILSYLPATLNMGDLLHDAELDDKTNKMEGPISTLMHNIGSAFSKPVTKDEMKKE